MITGTKYYDLFDQTSKSTKTVSGVNLIAEEIKTLLGFQKYSLFFGNEMGLGSEKYIHLTSKLAAFNLIKEDIEKLFTKYRRAKLIKTEMSFNDLTSELTITLTLSANTYSKSTFNVSFTMSN